MSGKYPSVKVGVSIAFESRTLELSCIHELEYSDDVLLYLDQAPKLKLVYMNGARKRSYLQTPDFVVVKNDQVVIIECKRLAVLQARSQEEPELYVIKDGRWTCPPAEADARRMGMRYELWTEAHFSYANVANLLFLGDYLKEPLEVPGYEAARKAIQQLLAVRAHLSIAALLSTLRAQGVCADHLYLAIARGEVAVDMDAVPVSQHDACMVYRDRITLAAFEACERTRPQSSPHVPLIHLEPGALLDWDSVPWTVLNVGASLVTLRSAERQQSLPVSVIRNLIRDGLIASLSGSVDNERDIAASSKLLAATEKELMEANRRLTRIEPYLAGTASVAKDRSIRRYIAGYRKAQDRYGNGFVGLIPCTAASGNRRSRLREDVLGLVNVVIDELYLQPTCISMKCLYGELAERCKESALPAPGYGWLCKFINRLPPELVNARRAGSKAAYKFDPRIEATELADATEPCRPFERAHVDHTLLDLETLDDDFIKGLGRMWLTIMIDHVSRRVLGFHLTYSSPSYRSVMAVMRDCVRRFGRLPDAIVIDGGKEFRSVWFETTCAWYHVTVIRRPPAKPRYGAYIERFFGTLNTTLIYSLLGNTQLTKNVRQMTAEVSPSRNAVWTFPEIYVVLEKYIFEVYDNELEHRSLAMTPRRRFAAGMEIAGHRPQRLIAYDKVFHINTCPSTAKGTAKVTRDGVKINYFYYNSSELPKHFGKSVPVRYDSEDMSRAYAHVDRKWVLLKARHMQDLRYKTEHDIALVTEEWRKRRSKVEKERLTDTALIKFLREVQQTQTLLKERRQAAQELLARQQREPEAFDEPGEFEFSHADAGAASSSPPANGPQPGAPVEAAKPLEIATLETY